MIDSLRKVLAGTVRALRQDFYPQIIHQTWKKRDLSDIEEFQLCSLSWQQMHPAYRYVLWDDADNERFVETQFPEYASSWKSFDKHIKRLDTIRYMWMLRYGGIYADLDMECLQPLPRLLRKFRYSDAVLFGDFDDKGDCLSINPALIVSRKGLAFWQDMLQYALEHADAYVTHSTGPFALSKAFERYGGRYRITILDQNICFIRKSSKDFYTRHPGNAEDHVVYRGVFAATPKPPKFRQDRKRKFVADWHGTPAEFRWHREYGRA